MRSFAPCSGSGSYPLLSPRSRFLRGTSAWVCLRRLCCSGAALVLPLFRGQLFASSRAGALASMHPTPAIRHGWVGAAPLRARSRTACSPGPARAELGAARVAIPQPNGRCIKSAAIRAGKIRLNRSHAPLPKMRVSGAARSVTLRVCWCLLDMGAQYEPPGVAGNWSASWAPPAYETIFSACFRSGRYGHLIGLRLAQRAWSVLPKVAARLALALSCRLRAAIRPRGEWNVVLETKLVQRHEQRPRANARTTSRWSRANARMTSR